MRNFLILFVSLSLLSACSFAPHAPIGSSYVPKPAEATAIAFDANDQNAGILEADASGVYVTDGWLKGYDAVAARYGAVNATESGDRSGVIKRTVCPTGKYKGRDCWLVTYEMSDRKRDMLQMQRDHASP